MALEPWALVKISTGDVLGVEQRDFGDPADPPDVSHKDAVWLPYVNTPKPATRWLIEVSTFTNVVTGREVTQTWQTDYFPMAEAQSNTISEITKTNTDYNNAINTDDKRIANLELGVNNILTYTDDQTNWPPNVLAEYEVAVQDPQDKISANNQYARGLVGDVNTAADQEAVWTVWETAVWPYPPETGQPPP